MTYSIKANALKKCLTILFLLFFFKISAQDNTAFAVKNDGDTIRLKVERSSYTEYSRKIAYTDNDGVRKSLLPQNIKLIRIYDGYDNPVFISKNGIFHELLIDGTITLLKNNLEAKNRYLLTKGVNDIMLSIKPDVKRQTADLGKLNLFLYDKGNSNLSASTLYSHGSLREQQLIKYIAKYNEGDAKNDYNFMPEDNTDSQSVNKSKTVYFAIKAGALIDFSTIKINPKTEESYEFSSNAVNGYDFMLSFYVPKMSDRLVYGFGINKNSFEADQFNFSYEESRIRFELNYEFLRINAFKAYAQLGLNTISFKGSMIVPSQSTSLGRGIFKKMTSSGSFKINYAIGASYAVHKNIGTFVEVHKLPNSNREFVHEFDALQFNAPVIDYNSLMLRVGLFFDLRKK